MPALPYHSGKHGGKNNHSWKFILPVESQVVLRENTPESKESLEDNSAKNFDLCRQLLSDLRSRFDETFGVSGNIRRLTRKSGDVGL